MKKWSLASSLAILCCTLLTLVGAADADGAKGVDTSPPNPFPFKDTGSPDAFLRDLYERYNISLAAAPEVQGRDDAALLDPELLALSRKEVKLANHEVGAFDADPICDCQDWDKVVVEKITVLDETRNSVTATVTVRLAPISPDTMFRYQLVRIDHRWRIHNIFYENEKTNMIGILNWAMGQGY